MQETITIKFTKFSLAALIGKDNVTCVSGLVENIARSRMHVDAISEKSTLASLHIMRNTYV